MLEPFEVLYEAGDLTAFPLPRELKALYGGTLGFEERRLFSNFVSTIDGVVSVPSVRGSVQMISGESAADRFLMALLRSTAHALLIGASTFSASKEARWTAESMYPPGAAAFAELRGRLGHEGPPELAVVTASGDLDPTHPALEAGALVLTTDRGAARLRDQLPEASTVQSLGAAIDARAAVGVLRARAHRLILSEGGPTLHGSLVAAGLADELFLTVSPLLAGRAAGCERLSLVERVELLPHAPIGGRLLGARRNGAHLFLRYELEPRPAFPEKA
jgi:riboflavin biosynthesis pyrimidine reductase